MSSSKNQCKNINHVKPYDRVTSQFVPTKTSPRALPPIFRLKPPRNIFQLMKAPKGLDHGGQSFNGFFRFLYIKGGRWHIIPQLAVYTTYIPLIYCLLGGYIIPTTLYRNLKNPLNLPKGVEVEYGMGGGRLSIHVTWEAVKTI